MENIVIEVVTDPDTPNKEKGDILEHLARILLKKQGFETVTQLRLTGMEVDLLGTSKVTGEKVYVECKAYRSSIDAGTLWKLLGQVDHRKCSQGWLVCTYDLTKDAKGIVEERNAYPPEERRKLQVYDPPRLTQRLIDAGIIINPEQILTDERNDEDVWYLLITGKGKFWARPIYDASSGMRDAVQAFHAETGKPVQNNSLLSFLASSDTSLRSLRWISAGTAEKGGISGLERERDESIVRVPAADKWADYRPARPEDFIGRESGLRSAIDLLSAIEAQSTRTRIFAIKAPSGWGKSSFLLKLEEKAKKHYNGRKLFVFSVDTRAARSSRFVEMALVACVREAQNAGFIKFEGDVLVGGADRPFTTDAMKEVNAELRKRGIVIALVFDQFEELLYREDLQGIFDEVRHLCDAIDAA